MASIILCSIAMLAFLSVLLFFVAQVFIGKKVSVKAMIIIMAVFTISATIISYFLVGNESHDLTRYYAMLDELKQHDFAYAFTSFKYKATPLTSLWFFTIAKLGNYHLLQTLPTLMSFACISYVAIDVYKQQQNIRNFSIAFLVCFVCVEQIFILTTVRYYCALALLGLAIYRYVFKNKTDFFSIALIIIACLIHYGCAIVLIAALLCMHNLKNFNIFYVFSTPILIFLAKVLMLIRIPFVFDFGDYLYSYIIAETIGHHYIIETVIFLVLFAFIYSIVYYNSIEYKRQKIMNHWGNLQSNSNMHYVVANLALFIAGLALCSQFLRRFSIVIIMIIFPQLVVLMHRIENKILQWFIRLAFLAIAISLVIFQIGQFKEWTFSFIG